MAFPLEPIALVSMETARALVTLGYGLGYDLDPITAGAASGRFTATLNPATGQPWGPLRIVDCTGIGVPVVVTTEYPHGVSAREQACGGLSCVIAGVLGNTAANNVDRDPTSRTFGLPAGTLAVPLTPTTLALYGQDPIEGNLIPLIGNGVYVSGGTITPAFTDGSILIGRDAVKEHSAPPRIVLVPRTVTSAPRSTASPNPTRRIGELAAQRRQRSIGTDVHTFDAHCWGASTPPDAARDFTLAMALSECLRAALHDLGCGEADMSAGRWDDQAERATQYIKSGHLLTRGIEMRVPVTDNPLLGGLPFIPAGTIADVIVQTPTPEIAAEFVIPVAAE